MASLNDRVFDQGLSTFASEANAIHICSQEPTTYTEAVTNFTLGNTSGIGTSGPQDRSGGGREVVILGVSGGNVTASGTATHFAVVDTVNSRLLATQSLNASQPVTDGDLFTLTQFSVGFPDPS